MRTKFHSIGGTVLKLIRGLTASLGREPEHQAYIADVRRWGVVWHYSLMQVRGRRREGRGGVGV